MGEVGRIKVERPYAEWLSVLFCSSSSVLAPPSRPRDTEGWLLEREKREKRIPPMPFPMLAAPMLCMEEREKQKERCMLECGLDRDENNSSEVLLPFNSIYFEV